MQFTKEKGFVYCQSEDGVQLGMIMRKLSGEYVTCNLNPAITGRDQKVIADKLDELNKV